MIVVAPLHEVDEAIRVWRPSHAIGMASPGAETARFPAALPQLRLTFHDIVEHRDGLRPVMQYDLDRLLSFSDGATGPGPLLIHCWAGVSRSPAAAYAVACQIAGPGREEELARRLRTAAPFATPNRRLVALADAALGRKGAMVLAINRIGRGSETAMGTTFVLGI